MDNAASELPSLRELQESIDELAAYRERLFQDVVGLGKKLRLSQKKIDATVAAHPELQRLDEVMSQLVAQRNAQQNHPWSTNNNTLPVGMYQLIFFKAQNNGSDTFPADDDGRFLRSQPWDLVK